MRIVGLGYNPVSKISSNYQKKQQNTPPFKGSAEVILLKDIGASPEHTYQIRKFLTINNLMNTLRIPGAVIEEKDGNIALKFGRKWDKAVKSIINRSNLMITEKCDYCYHFVDSLVS